MDRNTLSHTGWIIIALIVLAVVIVATTPLLNVAFNWFTNSTSDALGPIACGHTGTEERVEYVKVDRHQHQKKIVTVCSSCGKVKNVTMLPEYEDHTFEGHGQDTRCTKCGCVHGHIYDTYVGTRYEQVGTAVRHRVLEDMACFCGDTRENISYDYHDYGDGNTCLQCGAVREGPITYTITFNPNPTSLSDTVTNMPSPIEKPHNTPITLPSTIPVCSTYTFLGWSTSKSSSTADYAAGATFTTNHSTVLYAVWQHAHVFDKQLPIPAYLLSPANCQHKAKYYLSCSCGLSSLDANKSFEWGEKGDHVWDTSEPTLYVLNHMYEATGEGLVEVDYLHITKVGTIRDILWDIVGMDCLPNLDTETPLTPCSTCHKTNVKSAKIYELNRTHCVVPGCTATNSSYVLSWECYDCSITNTQEVPIAHITHTYGTWQTPTPATCTTAGVKKRICTYEGCDEYELEPIPALGHDMRFVEVITESTSSSVAGTKLYRCHRCGLEKVETYYADDGGDSSGHDCVDFTWIPTGEWESITFNHQSGHYPVKKCSKCGFTSPGLIGVEGVLSFVPHDIDAIPWEMHDGTSGLAVEGTSMKHYYWKHCSVCNLIIATKDYDWHNDYDVRTRLASVSDGDTACGYCGLTLTIYDYHCDVCGLKMRTKRRCENPWCIIVGQDQ